MTALAWAARFFVTGLPREGVTPEFERLLAETPPAGLLLFRRDFGHFDRLPEHVGRLRSLASKPLLLFVDEEGGFVSQIAPDVPVPPGARVLGRAASDDEAEKLGRYTGACLASAGIDVDFAPVLDVDAEPRNPVIGPRAFSGDPKRVSRLGLAVARGLESGGVLSCAKHFPGHGDTRTDSHLVLPRSPASESTLRSRDLPPFEEAIAAGVPLVLVSHVHYPAFDADERPATLSRRITQDLLRDELGFRGAAITDALEMKAIASGIGPEAAARGALEAGCDLLLYGAYTPEVRAALESVAAWGQGAGSAGPRDHLSRLHEERVEPLFRSAEANRSSPRALPKAAPLDLVALCRRALRPSGDIAGFLADPTRGTWLVVEPEWTAGSSLAELLRQAGCQTRGVPASGFTESLAGSADRILWAHAARVDPSPAEREAMGVTIDARPTGLLALGQDAFLSDFPAAAVRISASDPGEPMRRAVAEWLVRPETPAERLA